MGRDGSIVGDLPPLHPLIPVTAKEHLDLTVGTWGDGWFTFGQSVTALVPFIDEEGVAYLASDRLVLDADGKVVDEYGVKTARMNDRLCIGFSGGAGDGNHLLAHLFRHDELARLGANIDICKLLEAYGTIVHGAIYEEARRWITRQLAFWKNESAKKGEDIPDLNVVLVGVSEVRTCFSVWRCDHGWGTEESSYWESGETRGYPPGPIPDRDAEEALCGLKKKPPNRLRNCVRVFSTKRPDAVNRNVLIRRSSDGFRLPSDWPPADPCEWPVLP
jgi:hypothetical protein